MMPARFLITLLCLLVSACAPAREILVTVAYNNMSDSYLYPYRIRINDETGIPASLIGCSNGVNTASLATIPVTQPPRFVMVQWEHLVTRKVYRARINLSDKAGNWWQRSPFRDGNGKPPSSRPVLVVQWRGPKRVAAMLVADFTAFAKGKMDLGEAEGEETHRPGWGPKLYLGYSELTDQPGDNYRPGDINVYRRKYDDSLPPEQRFGCPRLPDGRLDTARLPPQKLPFLTGPSGEHIPCDAYFCRDKADLVRKLRKLGRRKYPPGQPTPAIEFRDAPDPKPAR